MFRETVTNGHGLSWLPLISRIVWAKTPQNPRDEAPLNFIFITVFVFFFYTLINVLNFFFGISHAVTDLRSLRYRLIHSFTALGQFSPLLLLGAERV